MRKCFLWTAAGIGALLLLGASALLLLQPLDREYALRLLRWGESDVKDYTRFSERGIANPPAASPLTEDPHPEWFTTIPYQAGGKSERASVDELMTKLRTQALIVIQDSAAPAGTEAPAGVARVLYEKYYNGYQRDSIVTSFSSVKSFNSAMIGRAIADGLIGGVDDPLIRYLPELKGRGLDQMSIRDLLRMNSGIRYTEDENLFPLLGAPFSDDAKTYYYPDLRRLALESVRGGSEPVGKLMHYNNYHPILEGLILERVSGMPVAKYLEQTIWQPLGMEYPASWSLDSQASGFEKLESGLNGRAIDFARFGLLYLRQGNWNGNQVLSADWVRQSTMPDAQDQREWFAWQEYPAGGGYYGYHWWGMRRADGHYDFAAAGNFGQYVYVCPQKHLVIARFGEDERVDSFWDVLYALEQMVPEE